MRRKKILENIMETVKIDVVSLSNEFPEISIDELANELVDNMGVNVRQVEEDGTVYMIIDTDDQDSLIEEISNFIYANTDVDDIDDIIDVVSSLIEESSLDESLDECREFDEDDLNNFPPYDEDDDEENDLNDFPPYDEDDKLDDCNTMEEDEDFECYESNKVRKSLRHRRLNERRKGCCPPKRKRMVNLSESIRKINKQYKENRLTENVIRNAMEKALFENKHSNKKQVILESIKKELGTDKFNLIIKSIKSGKKHLYENKVINGKKISQYSSKELYNIMKKVQEQLSTLNLQLNSLNESSTLREEIFLNEKIENKKKLLNILDEELTYRLSIKKLLKEDEEVKSEETNSEKDTKLEETNSEEDVKPEETNSEEDTKSEETDSEEKDKPEETNPEEDEEVELSRVVITLANQEAADELKSSMVDAGIPEDSIEIETEEPEGETEEESEGETEEGETEETTESLYINKFKKLLEDDEATEDDATEDNTEESNEESEDDAEGSEEESEENVKVILTNTDYINTLADVLDSEYGITKEEFEDMIGGEIVSDGSDEDSDEDSDKEDEDSDKEEDSENKSSGDEAIDAMSPEELDKLFANA